MVVKRNGSKVEFDGSKIKTAVKKANNSSQTKQLSPADIEDIADYIEFKYHKMKDEEGNQSDITIEEIQDMVEDQIMAKGAYEVARTYVRYRYSRMGKHDIEGIDKEANHKALSKLKIRKKNGTMEKYDADKILTAVNKSAARAREDGHLTEEEAVTLITLIESDLVKKVEDKFVPTNTMHLLIERYLDKVAPDVGKAYTNYHSFRMGQAESWEHIMGQCTTLIGNDRDDETMTQKNQNANADSTLSSTQKCFFADYTAEQYYEKFFLTKEERQIAKDGYLYWHDKNGRIIYSHNCFRRDTRFITEYGLKSFYDFSDGDEVYVLTHKGNWKKAVVRCYGRQPIQKVTFVKNNCFKDVYCTANHRWILKDGTETTELKEKDILCPVPNISNINWETMTLSQKRFWCHGFAIADGSLVKNSIVRECDCKKIVSIRLCGNKKKFVSYFEDSGYACTYPKAFNGDACVRITDLHSKEIDLLKLNKDNIVYFMNGYMSADGNKAPKNYSSVYRGVQVTGKNNDCIEDLLNIAGYYTTSKRDLTGTETNYGKRTKKTINYQCHETDEQRFWSVKKIEKATSYAKDTVWCLEVEDDHSFILEGGIPTGNCCLWRMDYVLEHGFMMNGIWYNKPQSLDVAFDVLGDLTLMAASQQYGGFTIPRIDTVLAPYAEKSFNDYKKKYMDLGVPEDRAEKAAEADIIHEMESGFQGLEYKFNTVASSRGDYPFTTVTFGLDTTRFGKMAAKICLATRRKGQGAKGKKKPVLFPKLVFLYDENLHGEGKVNHDVFEAGLECSSKTMYPDWLSLSGEGYIPSMYKKYGIDGVISPMGCFYGKEVITYKIGDNLYVESFERFWKRISSVYNVLPQPCDKGDGKYLYIDLEKTDIKIYDTKEGFVKVKKLIRNVSNNWNTVKMSNGRNWLCTTDHPFETINRGEVLAKDLNIGDKVWINSSSYSEETKVVEDDYAWLLGFMLCDGCYQNYSIFSSIALNGEDEIEQKFKETFPKYFGLDVKTVIQHRGKKGDYKDIRAIGDGTNKLSRVIDQLTELFGGVQKKNRHIPNEVFSWNYSAKMSFLAGMIDADGYIIDGEKSRCRNNTVEIGSTNKELAIGQMYLAQTLGMPARIYMNHYNRKKPDKIRYQVDFCGISELANYIVCEKKTSKLYELEEIGSFATEAEIIEIIPETIEDYSYDVETESGHLECSGVYSHNCRAFLSPYYERGGFEPADDDDKVVYEGRFNLGVISLNLPMMLAQAREEDRDFYEVLDYYLNVARENHKRTYQFIGHMKASKNPVGFCYGGFYGGNLKMDDEIAPVLKASTMSFGITALNELQRLYNGKSLVEDNEFALEVMKHINDKIAEFKAEDHILYAIYGTPAENLCNKQVRQFRAKYGIIPGVSDREYVSNSFHCHVTEQISPIFKQDREEAFWNLFNGGKIQYCRYPVNYNIEAMKTLILRAMKKGFYEGVNLSLCFCDDCGYSAIEMGKKCPKCGGYHITQIDRMNGYLAFTRVGSDTRVEEDEDGNKTLVIHSRYSPHKIKEISERISM